MDRNRIIGNNGILPRHFAEDLKFFKQSTFGQVVIMGRKTYESIGKPLPNRINVIISRTLDKGSGENLHIVDSLEAALELCNNLYGNHIIWIIGGSSVYQHALEMNIVDELYCTVIGGEFYGDARMVEFEDLYRNCDKFKTIEAENKDDGEIYTLDFYHFTNKA